jgi:uncharacterized membrane protein YczE
MEKKFGSLSSSSNPRELAATVSGLILTFSALIILIAQKLGFPLTQNVIANVSEQIGLAVGSLWFLFGVVRKIIIAIQQRLSR